MPNIRTAASTPLVRVPTRDLKRTLEPGACYPFPSDLPILIDRSHALLLGSSRVWGHDEHLMAMVVRPDHHQRQHLRNLDGQHAPLPSHKAHAAHTLRLLGLSLRTTQTILHATDLGTTSRWVRMGTLPRPTLDALDRGDIQFGHARYLLGVTVEQGQALLRQCQENDWTVQQLRRAVAGTLPSPSAAADIADFAGRLTDQLGASVRITWPDDPGKRRIAIDWYDVETLRGVLARLGEGTATVVGEPHRRELVFAIRDADELDALMGHVVS